MVNGLGNVFHFNNASLFDVFDCELDYIDRLNTETNLLLFYGFIVLIVCILILIPFYIYLDQKVNRFWNHIRSSVYDSYANIKSNLTDRLINIHGNNLNLDTQRNHKTKANFKNPWRFTKKICVYFLLTLGIFLINFLYLYPICIGLLYKRPEYLRDFTNDQLLFRSVEIWALEAGLGSNPWSLTYRIPNLAFASSLSRYLELHALIKKSNLILRDPKYRVILSDDVTKILFESDVNENPRFSLGVYPGRNIMAFEAGAGSDPTISSTLSITEQIEFYNRLPVDFDYIDDRLDELVLLVDEYSLKQIKSQMDMIIIVLVLYVLVSVALFLFVYIPFLNREKTNLVDMENILALIPSK